MSKKAFLRNANRYYMQSFLTIHYLYGDDHRRLQLIDYLKATVSGHSQDEAFEYAFSQSYKEFDKELKRYVSGKSLYARAMDKGKVMEYLTLPEPYLVSSIDDADFFKHFSRGIIELGETSISNSDKQSFIKEYNQRYNLNKNSAPKL